MTDVKLFDENAPFQVKGLHMRGKLKICNTFYFSFCKGRKKKGLKIKLRYKKHLRWQTWTSSILKKSVDSCHRQDVAIECDNVLAVDADETSAKNVGKSEKLSSVAGCNLNNDNAGRTLNANNSVRNGNDNYAGGFALNIPPFMEETLATCPPRANIKDNEASRRVQFGLVGSRLRRYSSFNFFLDL